MRKFDSIYDFKIKKSDGSKQDMAEYKGKVLLIVNVASKCGFTPQYEDLEKLYELYKAQSFYVLGFPCDQFGHQEPAENKEIQTFCKLNYGVTFPVMAKIEVNGDGADPLYKWLKTNASGLLGIEAIKWNFTKFLIDKNGHVINRYAPQTKPMSIKDDIEKALK